MPTIYGLFVDEEAASAAMQSIHHERFKNIGVQLVTKTDKQLPVCSECHSAHSIQRTDLTDFRLNIMDQCGRCHQQIAAAYFETFHGKVSKLGYLKTAKCYDCHGAHDILPVADPRSHLSRANVAAVGDFRPRS